MPKETTLTPDGIPSGESHIEEVPLETVAPKQEAIKAEEVKTEEPKEAITKEESPGEGDDKTLDFSEFITKKSDSELPITAAKPVVVPTAKPSRDLTDIDPELAPLFKQMSNEAFEKFKAIALEHKKYKVDVEARAKEIEELKKSRLPENYYEHPEGYRLDPEFAQSAEIVDVASKVVNHWRNQLRSIREGASDYEYLYINNDGKYAIDKRPADAAAEADILMFYNSAQHALINERQKLENFGQQFKTKFDGTKKWINDFEVNAFSLFDKEEGKHLKPIVEDTLNRFPAAIKNSIAARLLAKSLVTNQQLSNIVKQLTTAKPAELAAKEDKAKAGPTAAETMSGSSNGKSDITLDDFERLKAGL